jgi:solute:Na+ symporter, SSS family
MSSIDWIVLLTSIIGIIAYGIYKSRNTKNIEGFLLADREMPWYMVGLSVMATQASAITYLSAPAQGFTSGMGFVQFYFGLPLAMIVICYTFIPIFRKLNVYTAYEYLENRFDLKTRIFTSLLFLFQRGLSTGITIYAPAIILSTLLNVSVVYTTLFTGLLIIVYTVYGGAKAVSYTQFLQMGIIFSSLFLAVVLVIHYLPSDIGFMDALHLAGKSNKLNIIDTKFDMNNRYSLWSGLLGGFFLSLSYFGTDQSQVGRYLTGKSVSESRLGLIMNGLVKIPMQFLILLIGVLVFSFYQFRTSPLFFNSYELDILKQSKYATQYNAINAEHEKDEANKVIHVKQLLKAIDEKDEAEIMVNQILFKGDQAAAKLKRDSVISLMKLNNSGAETNDQNYIFLDFVIKYFPKGIIGLLIAIIFLAAMGATASGINGLVSTTTVDVYKRLINNNAGEALDLKMSRIITVVWGLFCIAGSFLASSLGNLIEAVNVIGSLVYGAVLGVFLVGFYFKNIKGNAVFYAAIITEILIVVLWKFDVVAFLWLNLIGCGALIGFSYVLQKTIFRKDTMYGVFTENGTTRDNS